MASGHIYRSCKQASRLQQRCSRKSTAFRNCGGPRYFQSQPANQRVPDFAFAFDIDGVLLRSATAIPGASASLSYLQQHQIPFILLTNGGGKTEAQRVSDLNARLSPLTKPITTSQFIQSHTPFAEYALAHGNPSYKKKCIMVMGGDEGRCRDVARSYGFENVITPGDIFAAYPDIWPFSSNFKNTYYKSFAEPLPKPVLAHSENPNESLKIDAVFVYNDPRDWGLDIQVLLDVLLSHQGIVGTYSKKNGDKSLPNNGYLQDGQPPVFYSNPDLLWANAYHLSRLGQGGFREAFEGVWRKVTHDADLSEKIRIMGKPHQPTYEFAEKVLVKFREDLVGKEAGAKGLHRVYMVGDNPESDIKGANDYRSAIGSEWISLLTRTGVYKDGPGRKPVHPPKAIVDDVREAVKWALRDSNWISNLDEKVKGLD